MYIYGGRVGKRKLGSWGLLSFRNGWRRGTSELNSEDVAREGGKPRVLWSRKLSCLGNLASKSAFVQRKTSF